MEQRDYIKRQIEQIGIMLGLRSVIDSMASSLQDGDPAKDSLTSLSDKLGAGTRAAYSTADFSDFQ